MKFKLLVLSILDKHWGKFLTYQFVSNIIIVSPIMESERKEYENYPDWDRNKITKHLHEEHRDEIIKTLCRLNTSGLVEKSPLKKDVIFLKKVKYFDRKELRTNKVVYKITKLGMEYYKKWLERTKILNHVLHNNNVHSP